MKKPIKLFGIALLAVSFLLGLASCDEEQPGDDQGTVEPGENENPGGNEDGGTQEIIKSLTAKEETVTVRVDENKTLSTYYTLTGHKSLSAAQKKCTYTSSDESVVKIANTMMKALKPGTAEITVTSKIDTTKTCKFTVVVKDVYFDRSISKVHADDDVEHELLEDGGYITTCENIQGEYFVKGVEGTKILATTEITINTVNASELYPKFGIVFSTTDKTAPTDNKIVFFLDAFIGEAGSTSWSNFGVCEVQNGGNWAWNPGVTDANARHKDGMYSVAEPITYGTKFKITVARDGYDFHMWVNDVYAGSMTTLEDLFGAANGAEWAPAPSYAGFFQFNASAKFENYSVTADAALVDAEIAKIAEKTYVTEWNQDAA